MSMLPGVHVASPGRKSDLNSLLTGKLSFVSTPLSLNFFPFSSGYAMMMVEAGVLTVTVEIGGIMWSE